MIRLYSEKNIFKFKTQISQSNWDIVCKCKDANLDDVEFMKMYHLLDCLKKEQTTRSGLLLV